MKILFLCTANSCRSVLCEAMFNHLAPDGFKAYSAGSHPSGQINPISLKTLEKNGISTAGLYSKSNDDHQALSPDFVITVCDKAAGEACPMFFGSSIKAHWGLADPSEHIGSSEEVEAAFDTTLCQIEKRIRAFLSLPLPRLSTEQLKTELLLIGKL